MNESTSSTEDELASSPRRRSISLPRLLTSTGAAFWLIDAEGKIAYMSPAMRSRLEIEEEIPENIAAALVPDPIEWNSGGMARGHLTLRLQLSSAQQVVAHLMRLDPISSVGVNETVKTVMPLVLGCLGEYVCDAEVPWSVWFGEQGIRETARVQERISRFRAELHRNVTLLLAGSASASRRFRARVRLACGTRWHVALRGTPGSGANEIASVVHHSFAPDEPMLCLDGSLMDAELLEVYASPIITDLRENSIPHGTLCLDRIHEMPADAQFRLIQWVETWPDRLRLIGIFDQHDGGEVSGGTGALAPTWSLDEKLSDLMSTFPIQIPTLAARRDDLELIVSGLVRTKRISREVLELLRSYPWPGEWDELKATMRFAQETATGDRIGREHLPLAIRSYRPPSSTAIQSGAREGEWTLGSAAKSPRDFQVDSLDEAVRQFEMSLITKAIQAADGNKAEAARRLGISRSRLLRKLEEFEGRSSKSSR